MISGTAVKIGESESAHRTSNRIVGDLCIDPEDLGDIAMDVAKRTGRSADDFETNPLFGKVELFVNHQPRLPGLRVG